FPPAAPPVGGAVGRPSPFTEQERLWLDFRTRSGTISRAIQEARNAGLDFQQFGRGLPNQYGPTPEPKNTGAKDKDKEKIEALTEKLKKVSDALKRAGEDTGRGSLTERLAAVGLEQERRRYLEDVQKAIEEHHAREILVSDEVLSGLAWALRVARGATGGVAVPATPTVPPGTERPAPVGPNALAGTPAVSIHTGPLRPQWVTAADGTEALVVMRAARVDNRTVYQGIVVDWPKLEQILKDEVKGAFPNAVLVPVRDPAGVSPDRAMTALPVQLDPGPAPEPAALGWTPLRIGLVLAWAAALVAFAAVGLSGWSLVALAERRIRFVSAVTHELRTPLTSLRLYLDLLMSGLIRDEAKKQEYLNTLATESDRLHRLVDNVLDFAKLEKRAKNGDMKPVKVGDLIDALQRTWADRVAADNKELVVVSTLPGETLVLTDAVLVQQIVGNLIDNARKYTREAKDGRIWLWAKPGADGRVVLEVEDRGPGVPAGERKAIFKPFRRGGQADAKAGGAGLGLALAKQWAEVLGGSLTYRPADGAPGACFRLELPTK
ncbi:MAG: HAMP domain-containing histidine kinase, partial [Planctomycetes bacterium]|nr:HAMP domain-containing histidine kinase [Planctomycetota bacterium]